MVKYDLTQKLYRCYKLTEIIMALLEPVTCATFTKLSTPSRVYWQFYDTFTFSASAEVTGLVLHFWRPVAPKLLTETENKLAGCKNGTDLLYYGPALSP